MKETEEASPFASKVLRKGLPILDRNLKGLLEEIQEKAKKACKESKGTDVENIVYEVNRKIQNVISDDQGQFIEILEDVISILKIKIPSIPENKYILSKIEALDNKMISPEKYRDLPLIVSLIPTIKVISEQELDQKLHQLNLIYNEIIKVKDKLSCISFDISKMKFNSADVVSDLKTMKEELKKLNEIEDLNTLSIEKLDSTQAEKLSSLNRDILERMEEVRVLIDKFPKNNDIQQFYDKLNELKQSKSDMLLQRSSAVISLIGFAIQVLQNKPF